MMGVLGLRKYGSGTLSVPGSKAFAGVVIVSGVLKFLLTHAHS